MYNKNANFAGMFLIELEALEVLFAGPVPLSVFMFTMVILNKSGSRHCL